MMKRAGFSLFEVVAALAIMGIMITALLTQQGAATKSSIKASNMINALLQADTYAIGMLRKRALKKDEPTITERVGTWDISYKAMPINDKSALKSFKNVQSARVKAENSENGFAESLCFITYRAPQEAGKDQQ